MRKTALALAALAVAAGPLAGVSSADSAAGCVTTYAGHDYRAPRVVWVDSYGRVVVDPNGANAFVWGFASNTSALGSCIV